MSEPGDHDDLRERLRALRVDPPENDFSASLHRRLVAAGAPDEVGFWRRLWPPGNRRPLLWSGAAGALACALLLTLFFARPSHLPPPARPETQPDARGETPMASAEIPATKVAMVRVNLSAEIAVKSADIRVTLPDGLVFWADGQALAQRSFEWSQPLNAGDNDIPIAVRGLRPGHYRMTVTAKMGEQKIEDDVLLEVVDG